MNSKHINSNLILAQNLTNLYFIAVMPPQKICEEIRSIQSDFANQFGSSAALKVIPHITLKAPVKLHALEHARLLDWFEKLVINIRPFKIELKNYGCFAHKEHPVIFIQPVMNDILFTLQKETARNFGIAYPEIPVRRTEVTFHPHITVAYKDLTFEKFLEAWEIYKTKTYSSIFEINELHLLQHQQSRWNVIGTNQIVHGPV